MLFNKTSLIRFLEHGLIDVFFTNLRNLLVCTFVLAGGTYTVRNPEILAVYSWLTYVLGWIICVFAILLMLVNIFDGVYKLSKLGISAMVYVPMGIVYFLVTIRLVIAIWQLRLG